MGGAQFFCLFLTGIGVIIRGRWSGEQGGGERRTEKKRKYRVEAIIALLR